MPSKSRKKKRQTGSKEKPKSKPNIFTPLDRMGPYRNSPKSSPFLNLPGEIRYEVYCAIFGNTRLSFGEKFQAKSKKDSDARVKPAMHSLGLLHTCRQIHIEANPLWFGLVLFHFGSEYAMLDRILALPVEVRAEIRQLRYRWQNLRIDRRVFHAIRSVKVSDYFTPIDEHFWPLAALSALRLDRVTILFAAEDYISFGFVIRPMITKLVNYGSGWKELHCIMENGVLLSELYENNQTNISPNSHNPFILQRTYNQVENWQRALQKRDGRGSGASFKVYRSTRCGQPHGSMTDPRFYKEVDKDKLPAEGILRESCKELLIVAKRATNADIMERPGPIEEDSNSNVKFVRYAELFASHTWDKLKTYVLYSPVFLEKERYDTYHSATEYSWQSTKVKHARKKKKPCL